MIFKELTGIKYFVKTQNAIQIWRLRLVWLGYRLCMLAQFSSVASSKN